MKTKLAASLLGLSQSSVDRALGESKNFPLTCPVEGSSQSYEVGPDPASANADRDPAPNGDPDPSPNGDRDLVYERALDNLIDICLANASEGRSHLAFERDAAAGLTLRCRFYIEVLAMSFCRVSLRLLVGPCKP